MSSILIVDDSKSIAALLEADLSAEGYEASIAYSGGEALSYLSNTLPDLIVLDLYLPDMTGLDILEKLRHKSEWSNIPVIMLSSSDNCDEIVAALDLGAADYVTKPYIAEVLHARIRTSLRLKEKTEMLEAMAATDFLTGIYNRRQFCHLATTALDRSMRDGSDVVIAMMDIDYFKKINDNYGHDAGDAVLVEFAQQLKTCFRPYDTVARLGGEEFAVCLSHSNVSQGRAACERFRELVENSEFRVASAVKGQSIDVTVSIGISESNSGDKAYASMLKEADEALYTAKANGRNQLAVIGEIA